jgi:hypothetical protein
MRDVFDNEVNLSKQRILMLILMPSSGGMATKMLCGAKGTATTGEDWQCTQHAKQGCTCKQKAA